MGAVKEEPDALRQLRSWIGKARVISVSLTPNDFPILIAVATLRSRLMPQHLGPHLQAVCPVQRQMQDRLEKGLSRLQKVVLPLRNFYPVEWKGARVGNKGDD